MTYIGIDPAHIDPSGLELGLRGVAIGAFAAAVLFLVLALLGFRHAKTAAASVNAPATA